MADGEFVIHTFITCRVFDLYGQTKEIVEEFLCIAYTIPMTGTIGVAIYRFLSNTPA